MALKFIETKKTKKISRREWLIGFSASLIILVSFVFPQASPGESFWLLLFLFLIFPAVIIGYLLKEPIKNFGFSLGKQGQGIFLSILIIAIFILINYYLVFYSPYTGQIPVVRVITTGFVNFLLYEFFLALPLHFFSEVFFRGFLQLGLEKKLGFFSLLLVSLLQTAPFFRSNWIVIGLIGSSSLAAGLIAHRSRSVFYSTAAMWIISISLDIMLLRVINQGKL
jgi:membrane protease YdiL (CAAX protease family)